MRQRFSYQPAIMDAVIFWGLIIAGYGLAVTLQMETSNVSLLAIIVALVTSLVVILQVVRYHGTISAQHLTLRRVLPSNTLTIPVKDLNISVIGKHRLLLQGTPYGDLQIGTWRKASLIAQLLNNHN
ncbi:EbsA family protein [Lacticaseibacillus sharpeae]|uniref:EbsA family protein n=1 Tax=Lacticaseibacillus sharpeae TaxID=1626 RepID=UPI0006D03282|nr:EbsA family protein [Lacticaseibacillus sharpeae]